MKEFDNEIIMNDNADPVQNEKGLQEQENRISAERVSLILRDVDKATDDLKEADAISENYEQLYNDRRFGGRFSELFSKK